MPPAFEWESREEIEENGRWQAAAEPSTGAYTEVRED